MLEGLATWFLNNYLGSYLQDLNTDQLSIALLQGEVELESVPLRRDALRYVNGALDVLSGVVGRIKLKIPVARLRSEPWLLVMEDIFLVVGPTKFEDFDQDAHEKHLQEVKLAALDGIEAQWRAEHDKAGKNTSYYPSYASWMSYGTSLIGTVTENLQIQVKNVHIRYEDSVSYPSMPYSCGFVLESLAAQTCDENKVPKFVHRDPDSQPISFKLVEFNKMAAYLNVKGEMFGDLPLDELKLKMKLDPFTSNDFILNPVCAVATVKRNCSERPLASKKTPRVTIDLTLDDIPLEISDQQYQCVMAGARSLHTLHQNKAFWMWRPTEPIIKGDEESLTSWWHYAITCHMERISDRNEATRWDTVLRKGRENVIYVRAFKAYLDDPVTLDPDLKEVKVDLDASRSYEELRALRELAVYYLRKERGELEEKPKGKSSAAASTDQQDAENEFFFDDSSPEEEVSKPQPSMLQSYFPGWYSSGAAASTSPDREGDEAEAAEEALEEHANYSALEEELEELLDEANIVPYKDLVFAQLSFRLKEGSLKLYSKTKSYPSSPVSTERGSLLFELGFSDMKVEAETRPRTRSYKFGLTLGGLSLRDMITPNSMFPLLVSPQSVQGAPLFATSKPSSRSYAAGIAKSFQNFLPMSSVPPAEDAPPPLFFLLYETRPFSSPKTDIKLHLRSQPLNVVYNPTVFHCISEFFQIPEELNKTASLSERIRSAAFERLEEAKQRTKEEFLRNLNSMLEGHSFERKKWDIVFDLSAPQIIIPEHFVDKNALIMVVDFGKFQLTNGDEMSKPEESFSATVDEAEEDEDEDEEFVTPASSPGIATPPKVHVQSPEDIKTFASDPRIKDGSGEVTEQLLLKKMYDRYKISMNGMQVILGKVKDDWRRAHLKGVSSMHVLDKFSIALQCERRIVQTADPSFPNIVVSGTLPKLVVHFNEDKVFALERMGRLLLGDAEDHYASKMTTGTQTEHLLPGEMPSQEEDQLALFSEWSPKQDVDESSKLLVLQFIVSEMSVELQSQEKSIAELQVTGVRASLTRKPYDTNIVMSVHSLLLVDALQTFGPNFDLLVASHRHVTMDSVSGSLLGSEPVSPMSPGSPDPGMGRKYETSPNDIKKALSSLKASASSRQLSPPMSATGAASPRSITSPGSIYSPRGRPSQSASRQPPISSSSVIGPGGSIVGMEIHDPDALISVDILIVSPNCPSMLKDNEVADGEEPKEKERLQIVSIQFNSLDVIANQETIVELLAFFKRVAPAATEPMRKRRRVPVKEMNTQTVENLATFGGSLSSLDSITQNVVMGEARFDLSEKRPAKFKNRLEVTAEFSRLNVLLLRAVTGKMIGTALLTEAKVHASIATAVSVQGSLGGLQVNNLLSGSTLHQKIISVGKDPMIEESKNMSGSGCFQHDLYPTQHSMETPAEEKHALTFSLVQHHTKGDGDWTPSGPLSTVGTPHKEFLPFRPTALNESEQQIELELRMASVCYVHSTSFLEEINSCATDFKQYMSNLAASIRMAATEIALGIVHRRAEAMSHQTNMDETFGTTPPKLRRGNTQSSFRSNTGGDLFGSLDRRHAHTSVTPGPGQLHSSMISAPAPTPRPDPKRFGPKFDLHVDMVMETPVMVVPRHERSFEVLVAHLGQITLRNKILLDGQLMEPELANAERVDRVKMQITEMNVHSIDLREKFDQHKGDSLNLLSQFKHMTSQELYSSRTEVAVPILHDTAIDLRLDRIKRPPNSIIRESESYSSFMFGYLEGGAAGHDPLGATEKGSSSDTNINLQGMVMNPLKVSLSRSQYELLMDAIKTLSEEGPEQKESLSRKTSFVKAQSSDESSEEQEGNPTQGSFEIPDLIVELRGDLMSGSAKDNLVRLECQEFVISFDKREKYKHTMEIALKKLIMEDLQLKKDSKHRLLMTSVSAEEAAQGRSRDAPGCPGVSTSCPEFWYHDVQQPQTGSLPNRLNPGAVFGQGVPRPQNVSYGKKQPTVTEAELQNPLLGADGPPATPPPSAVSSRASPIFSQNSVRRDLQSEENLVHIKIENLDSRMPDFLENHNCTNRYVDVDFNTLDINFNMQTWVVVLDFLGIGSAPSQAPKPAPINRRPHGKSGSSATKDKQEPFNTEIELKVKALSVVFNKPDYEVASASVQNYSSRLSLRDENFAIHGRLGSFSLKDLTQQGAMYKDRFLSRGENALTFYLFRHGKPDEKLTRPYDIMLKLRMAGIIYVHTHRFYSELLSFFFQFEQLQSVMSRIREAAAGGKVKEIAARGTRVKLDIEAGSPLLLLPMSSYSPEILAIDLGFLEIGNTFKFSGDEGTVSAETLSSGAAPGDLLGRRSRTGGSSVRSRSSGRSVRSGKSRGRPGAVRRNLSRDTLDSGSEKEEDSFGPLPSERQKCLLDVLNVSCKAADLRCAERLSAFTDEEALSPEDIRVGSFIVRLQPKALLKEKFELKLQIERNLDKAFSHRVPDMSVKGILTKIHSVIDVSQYTLIRGLLGYNFGEPLDDLDFQVPTNEYQDPRTNTILTGNVWTGIFMDFDLQDVILDLIHSPKKQLARINFLKSRLVFESFSDNSKDVDLVSREILLSDLRFTDCPANKRSNVFTQILQPMLMEERNNPLQAEIHFRATPETNRFTILVNNMRLMGIFDWWMAVLEFIYQSQEMPEPLLPENNKAAVAAAPAQQKTKVFLQEEPLYPSAGVISRRAPLVESKGPVFDLKLNITDSEVIIVADASQIDCSTVILRSTTVIAFRPDMVDRPFSCNLNNAEVFSCVLGREDESALSIIDPVTINFEIGGRGSLGGGTGKGLLDLAESTLVTERTAEIQLQQLNVRLSYHDWLMFSAILDSFPEQARVAMGELDGGQGEGKDNVISPTLEKEPTNVQTQVTQLLALGFKREDCMSALKLCNGKLDDAAIWLTQNATPAASSSQAEHLLDTALEEVTRFLNGTPISFRGLEIKTASVNICIIDDCKDADVPLAEVTMRHLHMLHDHAGEGSASSTISGSYFNRALSSWEPFMEPWRCLFDWKLRTVGNPSSPTQKLAINLITEDSINFNLTTTLIELYQMVKTNWTEDYYNLAAQVEHAALPPGFRRRRTPFVPFAMTNATGCSLWFCTQTHMSGSRFGPSSRGKRSQAEAPVTWKEIPAGATLPFQFEDSGKLRHLNSHDMKIHQVIVRVEGWQEVTPVSVDRVGTYFRKALPMPSGAHGIDYAAAELPPARVVFQVSLDGSAKKSITVRSALEMENKLGRAVDVKLENSALKPYSKADMITLQPGDRIPIPLGYVWSRIYSKPHGHEWRYCEEPIHWYHIMTKEDNTLRIHSSKNGWKQQTEDFRFAVSVKRINYPLEQSGASSGGAGGGKMSQTPSSWIQPAHLITLVSPVVIVNLLPYHLTYKQKDTNQPTTDIKPGKESLLSVDTSEQIVLSFFLDQFPNAADLILPPNYANFEARVKVTDSKSRPLYLQIRVTSRYGGAIKVTVGVPIWIMNKTGLPLVFKEEGSQTEAGGQDVEHEIARMAAPLMFSFLERENIHAVTMRIGTGLHPEGKTTWCKNFFVQAGSSVRKLRVCPRDHRVEWVYIIGIEVRLGKGRYRDTHIITLAPRFQLHNQSQHKIQFAQRCYANTFTDPAAEATHLQALPTSTMAFHWPRLDRDQLLCIRLVDVRDCQWSGGFIIDGVCSFHVNVRDGSGRSNFMRIEVGLLGATFSVILTDAGNFPPPFRIDNFSEVNISYFQTGVPEESMRSVVKAHHSLPYAWDEPTQLNHLTCSAPGGSTATYNMDVAGEGLKLTYENFIYIALTGTFQEKTPRAAAAASNSGGREPFDDVESQQLVLDVEGVRVFLSRKETGKRSQLWRMTSTGMLQHEGSSPPQDPRKAQSSTNKNMLVLDISGPAVQPSNYVPLMLRKYDERRQLTQRWKFTESGKLVCAHKGLMVQCKDGFMGLKKGSEIVLGPAAPVCFMRMPDGTPIEQAITRQRLRPGSGQLSVKVTTDGPTRVLQIWDVQQQPKNAYARLDDRDWLLINEDKRPSMITSGLGLERQDSQVQRADAAGGGKMELQLGIQARQGLGLSLVSRDPHEELLYAFMSNVVVEYISSPQQQILDGSVQFIQIDSQLPDAACPIILYLSPSNKSDEHRHMPAISFNANKNAASKTDNAEIYKHLMVTVKNVTLSLDEELLCKALKFAGITRSDQELEKIDESAYEAQRALIASTTTATRYYFGNLKLTLNQVKLSVIKSPKLTPDLQAVKRKLGLGLITFEDANIELMPFVKTHPFETINFLTNAVVKHYQDELLSQAVLILGSTDFLGNPLGFLNDVSEGFSGLVSDGNVGGLVRSVTHGAANSAAKVTGSLSAGLSKATLDERYDERRLGLRKRRADKSKEHFVAGMKGLGFGMLGGLTSVVTETYDGVANDGVTGFFTGLGWGLVGTISKPAIGVLDLATGAATAVKDASRNQHRVVPKKMRPARLVLGPGGSMPIYSEHEGQGQERMYRMNGRDYNEIYVGHEQLRGGDDDLQCLITSERVLVFSMQSADVRQLLTVRHAELMSAKPVVEKAPNGGDAHYVEILMEQSEVYGEDGALVSSLKRPQVRCDNDKIARTVSQQINYARTMYEERTQAVIEDDDEELWG